MHHETRSEGSLGALDCSGDSNLASQALLDEHVLGAVEQVVELGPDSLVASLQFAVLDSDVSSC